MGVATPETQTKANPALMKGLTFLSGQKLYDAANAKIKVAVTGAVAPVRRATPISSSL